MDNLLANILGDVDSLYVEINNLNERLVWVFNKKLNVINNNVLVLW
jgi:hypothetical protein